jgi:hypothetical protein
MPRLNQAGPGMFPMALGYLLAGLGALIVCPRSSGGNLPKPDFRPFVTIPTGVAMLAFTANSFGMVPAIFLLIAAARRELRRHAPGAFQH